MIFNDTSSETEGEGKRFLRRQDFTPEKRLQIAYLAMQGVWGVVSHLAATFVNSRTFVYQLQRDLQQVTEQVFGVVKRTVPKEAIRRHAIVVILCLRLEGRCSIPSISQLMKRWEATRWTMARFG